MAQRTIARIYDKYDEAKAVVQELESAGVPHKEISLIANADAHGRSSMAPSTETQTTTAGGAGAVVGTLLGGGAGLLAGIGSLAIPGVGPVVAAGWLVATLTGAGIGAVGGGLIGSLTGAGVSHEEADVYAEGVRRGGTLVTVRVDDTEAARIESVFDKHGSADWQQRRAAYGADWKGFDPNTTDAGIAEPGGLGIGGPTIRR